MFWTIVLAILFVTVGIPLIIVVFLAILGFIAVMITFAIDTVRAFIKTPKK
jgi:hypothetical protein